MNINSIVNQINSSVQMTGQSPVSEGTLKAVLQNGSQMLSSEGPGGFISGKIVSLDGNEIVLSLGPNAMINAKLEGSLIAQLGQNVSFIVNNQGEGKFSLSPLFENTSQSNTVNSALEAAGLPATPENQYMVKSMMQEGLSIDRQSLYSMSKAVSLNPDAEVLDLCKMTRLNIPTEPEMVQQFKNYTNFEHEVVNALKDISDSLSESIPENPKEITKSDLEFIKNSLDIMLKDTGVTGNETEGMLIRENSVLGEDIPAGEHENTELVKASSEETINVKEETTIDFKEEKGILKDMATLDFPPSVRKEAFEGTLTQTSFIKNVFSKVAESIVLEDEGRMPKENKEALKNILDSDVFKEALKQKVVDKFTLQPEEVAEDGRVSRLYEKLSEQIKSLSDSVNLQGKGDTPFAGAVNNLNSNVDFMNQLNQTFNYVQIPLKMNGQDSTGELYVYTKKKNLQNKDGNFSALLHLDMDHLGPMDVYVAMQNYTKVNTHFYLQTDELLDFVESHIDELNKRLEALGYNANCQVTQKNPSDGIKPITEEFMKVDESDKPIQVSKMCFDVRA